MARKVRVAAFGDMCPQKPREVSDNLDWSSEIIDLIAYERPDIICLTETFDTREVAANHSGMAQTLEGPTFARMAQKAREHGCYIVCAFIERRGERIYNTAAVIDRQGKLVGRYDKTHPTNSEIEDQIVPGDPAPAVIQTDFGKIGCQICFDANWPEDWKTLKEAGAEIVFFPSAFSAGRLLESMATIFHIPVVAACIAPCCRIIDRDGLTLNRQGVYQKWVLATLDLDNPLFHLDYQFEKMEQVRRTYGSDVIVKVYEEEGWWRVLPQHDDLDILEIIRRFDLEPLEAYFARSARFQAQHRA